VNVSLERLLGKFQNVARQKIRKEFNATSCIPSTRVTIDVLRAFHIEAEPLPVRMSVANELYMKALSEGDLPPEDERGRDEWSARTGACSRVIGMDDNDNETVQDSCFTGMPFKPENFIGMSPVEPDTAMFLAKGEWNGHLVAHIPKYHLFIDASANQANWPEKNIKLPGVIVIRDIDNRFLHGDDSLSRLMYGCLVQYEVSSNQDYLQSDAWKDKSLTEPTVKAIYRAMRRTGGAR